MNKIKWIICVLSLMPMWVIAQGNISTKNISNKMNVVNFSVFSQDAKLDTGYWEAEIENELICIEFIETRNKKQETRNKKQAYLISYH